MIPDSGNEPRASGWTSAIAFHDAHRRVVHAVLLGLIVITVVHAVAADRRLDTGAWMTSDSPHYLDIADTLRTTHTFSAHLAGGLQPEAWRLFGYPAFLALIETLTGGPHPLAIVIVQEGLFLLAVVLVGRFCARFHTAGENVFLGLVLAYPNLAEVGSKVMADGPCLALVVLGTMCLQSRRRRGAVAGGFLLGLTAWFRANLLFLGTAAGLGMALWGKDRSWKHGLIVAAVSLAVMLPNSARNHRLFGSISPLPYVSGTGPELYWMSLHSLGAWNDVDELRGLAEDATPAGGVTAADAVATAQLETLQRTAHGRSLDDLASFPTVADQQAANRIGVQFAIANIRAHPGPYLAAVGANLMRMWIPSHERLRRFALANAMATVCEAAVLALGVYGMFLALRHPEAYRIPGPLAAAAAAMCLYVSGSLCWFLYYSRYTAPVALFMLAFAALAATHLISALAAQGQRALPNLPRRAAVPA